MYGRLGSFAGSNCRRLAQALMLLAALILPGCFIPLPLLRTHADKPVEKEEKSRERVFRWGWHSYVATPGEPSAENPEYDEDGNLIVPKEISRTYQWPDMHTGMGYDIKAGKLRNLLETEIFEMHFPRTGRWAGGVVGGESYIGGHFSKQWTSIIEIESGVFAGRDFEDDEWTYGIEAFIIKF